MPKSAAQKAARKRRKQAKASLAGKSKGGPMRRPILRNPVPVNRKARRVARRASQGMGGPRKGLSHAGNSISMVSDGVNVGSVWKNTTAERVTFPMAREKFADLTSSGTTLQTLVQQYINPGNTELFPIFSQIAKNYEQYECNHLKILFRTEEYMASGSVVSAGLTCLSTNFDPDAANFATFTQAENYEHSISGAPFSGIIEHDVLAEHRRHRIMRGNRGNDLALMNYFVNYSPNQLSPSATPAKFYDLGNFQALVTGTQAGLIGELWIEYSFTMIRRLQQPGSPFGGVAHFSSLTATSSNNFAGSVLQAGNTLAGVVIGSNTITFPAGQPGNYKVDITMTAGTSVGAIALASLSAGATGLTLFTSAGARDASDEQQSLAGTTVFAAMLSVCLSCTAAGGVLTITPATIVTSGAGYLDIFITSLPSSVVTLSLKNEKEEIDELRDEVREMREFMRLVASRSDGSSSSTCSVGMSEPVTPDESKESDLQGSVHISRSMASRLSQALRLK